MSSSSPPVRVYWSCFQVKMKNKTASYLSSKPRWKKFLVVSPRRVLSHPLQMGSATARCRVHSGPGQERFTHQKEGFSVSKIRGAPQLKDPTEWALPHLTLRRFTSPPTSARYPPLCLFSMGMPTPVGWRCSLYRSYLSLSPTHSLSDTHIP